MSSQMQVPEKTKNVFVNNYEKAGWNVNIIQLSFFCFTKEILKNNLKWLYKDKKTDKMNGIRL